MTDRIQKKLKEFSLVFRNLGIESKHIEDAMGRYQNGTPGPFPNLIKKAIDDISLQLEVKGGYRYCDDIDFTRESATLRIENVTFSVGRIIGRQINAIEAVAVFACTAGSNISDLSKTYMQRGDLIQGYILDTIGSVTAEKAMDVIQEKLAEAESRKGRKITNRFSPGYCDWHIKDQQQLFSLLPKNFCGITLTESSLMLPIKSVSGIIGIGENVKSLEYPCKICKRQKCFRRKDGD
jgi:hypothetical protein